MNMLLHSKTFKKNLLKWIIIYFGVIALFTSVVTYSKYISSQVAGSTASIAKFQVDIIKTKICSTLDTERCNYYDTDGNLLNEEYKFKPYDSLDFYFNVDTQELEVSTKLVLTIHVDSSKVKVISINGEEQEEDRSLITLIDPKMDMGTIKEYIIRVEPKGTLYESEVNMTEAIKIDYSAVQID